MMVKDLIADLENGDRTETIIKETVNKKEIILHPTNPFSQWYGLAQFGSAFGGSAQTIQQQAMQQVFINPYTNTI